MAASTAGTARDVLETVREKAAEGADRAGEVLEETVLPAVGRAVARVQDAAGSAGEALTPRLQEVGEAAQERFGDSLETARDKAAEAVAAVRGSDAYGSARERAAEAREAVRRSDAAKQTAAGAAALAATSRKAVAKAKREPEPRRWPRALVAIGVGTAVGVAAAAVAKRLSGGAGEDSWQQATDGGSGPGATGSAGAGVTELPPATQARADGELVTPEAGADTSAEGAAT